MTREITLDIGHVNHLCDGLEVQGREDLLRQGFVPNEVRHQVEFDMRYGNQLVQLSVPSAKPRLTDINDILNLIGAFGGNYSKRFGKKAAAPEAGIKIVAVRVVSWVPGEAVKLETGNGVAKNQPRPGGTRKCYFPDHRDGVETSIYRWGDLHAGANLAGPAIVEAPQTTLVVEPGWELSLGASREVWLNRRD